jgi:hypothetical protein
MLPKRLGLGLYFGQPNPLPIPLYTLSAFDSEVSLRVGQIYREFRAFIRALICAGGASSFRRSSRGRIARALG